MSSGCRWATAALSLWGRQVGAQRQQGLSPAPHSPPLPSSLLRGPGFLCSDGLTVGWWEALVSEDIGSLAGCIDAPRGRIAELTAFWDQTAKKCGPPPSGTARLPACVWGSLQALPAPCRLQLRSGRAFPGQDGWKPACETGCRFLPGKRPFTWGKGPGICLLFKQFRCLRMFIFCFP